MSSNTESSRPELTQAVEDQSQLNLKQIENDLKEKKRKLPPQRLLLIVLLLISISLGYVAGGEIIEANSHKVDYGTNRNPNVTQYELDEGINLQPNEGLNDQLCVIRLAGEGLAALPDGCWWQMNNEGKLHVFNETDQNLVLVLGDTSITPEQVASLEELSFDADGEIQYRISPGGVSVSIAPSEIEAVFLENPTE